MFMLNSVSHKSILFLKLDGSNSALKNNGECFDGRLNIKNIRVLFFLEYGEIILKI